MKIHYFFLISSLFFSCTSKEENKNVIDVPINVDEISDLTYSDIFELDNIVELDTSILIANINKIQLIDNNLFIHCTGKASQLVIKDLSSNQITLISERGNAPEQFLELTDFIVDTNENQVIILDGRGSKILKYDLKGKHLTTIKNQHLQSAKSFYLLGDNTFAIYGGSFFYGSENHKLIYLDLIDGNVKEKFFELSKNQAQFMHFIEPNNFSKDSLFFHKYDNYIYKISDNSIEKLYYVDFNKKNLPSSILDKNFMDVREFVEYCRASKYAFGVSNILKSKDVMFFTFEYESKLIHVYHNIKTSKTYIADHIFNNLYGSFTKEKTTYDNRPIGVYGNKFIFLLEPYKAKNELEIIREKIIGAEWNTFYSEHKEYINMVDTLQKDANPFLIIMKSTFQNEKH